MRILIATCRQHVVGGVEVYLREVIPGLAARGHEIALAVEYPAKADDPSIDPTRTLRTWLPRDNDATFREMAEWAPDVCFVNGMESTVLETRLVHTFPSVMFAHNYHGTCVSGNKRFRFPSFQPCQRRFGLGCLVCYLPRQCGGRNPLSMIDAYRQHAARNRLLPIYRAVVVASRHMAQEYGRHGVSPDRLKLIPLFPCGQKPDLAPPSPRSQSGRVLFVGRLVDNKGPEHAVRAIALAAGLLGRRLSLEVAGDGSNLERMRTLAERLSLPVKFHGWIASAECNRLMREADVLVVSSTWPEPFGLVGVEAGCVGLPAAGFAVGGIPDWLVPGVSGESSSSITPIELARAIERCLRDADHWQALRVGAWQMAKRFGLTAHLDSLEAVLAAEKNNPQCVRR